MRILLGVVLLGAAATTAHAADKAPPPRPSAEPDWSAVRRQAEAVLTADFYDPKAAQFIWNGGWRWGHIKPFQLWSRREWGWLGCVGVNGKNRMGGYVGETPMYVLLTADGKMKAGPLSDVTSECDDGSPRVPLQAAFADAAPPAAGGSVADELVKLADLRSRGILDEAEFQAQKAKLLAR